MPDIRYSMTCDIHNLWEGLTAVVYTVLLTEIRGLMYRGKYSAVIG